MLPLALCCAALWFLAPCEGAATSTVAQATVTPSSAPRTPDPGDWRDLLAGHEWYRVQPGAEREFTGLLTGVSDAAHTGSDLQRGALYRLDERALYTGNRRLEALDRLVGSRVVVRGKSVTFALEGRTVEEIWPGRIRTAGGADKRGN